MLKIDDNESKEFKNELSKAILANLIKYEKLPLKTRKLKVINQKFKNSRQI